MNPTRAWTIGSALAIVVIVVFGWTLGASPKFAEASAAVNDRKTIESQNAAQELVLAGLREQNENLDDLQDKLESIQGAIPSEPGIETFLEQVNEIATRTGVSITTITAAEPMAFAGVAVDESDALGAPAAAASEGEPIAGEVAETASANASADGSALIGRLYTVAVSVSVTGSPTQVLDFTGQIQGGERLFLATGVTFAAESSGPGGTLTGYVFVVRSEAAEVTPPPAG